MNELGPYEKLKEIKKKFEKIKKKIMGTDKDWPEPKKYKLSHSKSS